MTLFRELPSAYPPAFAGGLKPDQHYLATLCALTPSGTWLCKRHNDSWGEFSSTKAAKAHMIQCWLGGPHHITDGDIKDYMNNKGVPAVVNGMMRVPISKAQFIEFQDTVYINSWRNTIMAADYTALNDPFIRGPLTLLIRMLRESLCNRQGAHTLDEMITLANSDDPAELEFRFLMNWLSMPIQHPGYNLQVNCWLVGEMGGTGKGTLYNLMSRVYGADLACLLNADEIQQGGWTDKLEGKLFVAINEINPNRKFDWNSFIKQNSTEDTLQIRKRNHHSHDTLNYGNWLFTSNNEGPAVLDAFDRRNCIIACTNDPKVAHIAQEVRDWMRDYPDLLPRLLGAFVAVLQNQRITLDLIERAPDTLIKSEVQSGTARDSEYDYWLVNDPIYPRDSWQFAHELLDCYRHFMHLPADWALTPQRFGQKLAKLARHGKIERAKVLGSTHSAQYRITTAKYPILKTTTDGQGNTTQAMVIRLDPPNH